MLRLPGRLAVWAATLGSCSLPRAVGGSPAVRTVRPVCPRRTLWTSPAAAAGDGGGGGGPDWKLTDAEWRARLTPHQYAVTRLGDTEPAFSGRLPAAAAAADRYGCACCGAPLFRAGDKFDSGSG